MDEEFYDSLDEDVFYDSRSKPTSKQISFEKIKDNNKNQSKNKANAREQEEYIPFFEKDVAKCDVRLKKGSQSSLNATRKNKKQVPNVTQKKNNSYLKLFKRKTGDKNYNDQVTPRSTATTMASCNSCAYLEDFSGEVLTAGQTETDLSFSIDRYLEESSADCHSNISSTSMLSDISKLKSVSQNNFDLDNSDKKPLKCKLYKSLKPNFPPLLGGLGPNIPTDKLEMFRKKQLYGKSVSTRNRIKIIEQRALEDLDNEMKDFRKAITNKSEVTTSASR